MPELAKQAIARLETRKYKIANSKPVRVQTPVSDMYSNSSGCDGCAICLDEYDEGQVIRGQCTPDIVGPVVQCMITCSLITI